jgi:hypothetical protein
MSGKKILNEKKSVFPRLTNFKRQNWREKFLNEKIWFSALNRF